MVLHFNGVSSVVTSPKDNICNILGHIFKQIVLNVMVEIHSAENFGGIFQWCFCGGVCGVWWRHAVKTRWPPVSQTRPHSVHQREGRQMLEKRDTNTFTGIQKYISETCTKLLVLVTDMKTWLMLWVRPGHRVYTPAAEFFRRNREQVQIQIQM